MVCILSSPTWWVYVAFVVFAVRLLDKVIVLALIAVTVVPVGIPVPDIGPPTTSPAVLDAPVRTFEPEDPLAEKAKPPTRSRPMALILFRRWGGVIADVEANGVYELLEAMFTPSAVVPSEIHPLLLIAKRS